jgi:hypothetical protein
MPSDPSVFASPLRGVAVPAHWLRSDAGNQQVYNAFWHDLGELDPMLRRARICIEILLGGDQILRVTAAPGGLRAPNTADGATGEFAYEPLLAEEPVIEGVTGIGQQQASARSLAIRLPAERVRPDAILARGRTLTGIAEVSLQVDGREYAYRYVLMRGIISGARFGEPGEDVELEIVDARETESVLIPEVPVDTTRWPLAQDSAIGERYPLIFNGYAKIPGIRVRDDHGGTGLYFLIADGHGWSLTTAYANGVAVAGGYAPATLLATLDALGRAVTVIDATLSAGPWADQDVVHATLTRSGLDQTPIDILDTILRGYTRLGSLGVNAELMAQASIALQGIAAPSVIVNASGGNTARALDWLEGGLLGAFPMIHLIFEGRGIGPIVIDRRTGPVIGNLIKGEYPLFERLTTYEESGGGQIFTEFEVRGGFDTILAQYTAIARRDPTNSPTCAYAQDVAGGRRPMSPIESPYLSAENAEAVVDWLVAHYALPSYYVEWSVAPAAILRYRRGSNVEYSDPLAGFSECRATVERTRWDREEGCVLGLRVWHPYWSSRALG